MAQAQSTTATLTAELSVYYDKLFLERAALQQKYDFFATKKVVPANTGKVVYWTRQTAFTPKTTALTEGTNPTGTPFSSTTVSATLGEFGDTGQISSLLSLTGIDVNLKEKVETMAQYAGESMDTFNRNTLVGNVSSQLAGAKSLLTAVNSTDTMSVAELRKAVLTLNTNKALTFDGGLYRGVITAQGIYELQGDSTAGNWINVNIYNSSENAEMVKKGVIGRLYGVDIVPTNNQYSVSSTTTVYSSFVGGKESFGTVDINGGSKPKVIVIPATVPDHSNPLQMYSTVSWKVPAFAAAVLNSNWAVEIRHA